MNAIKMNITRMKFFSFFFLTVVILASCNEEDPFVDRVEAPVLLDFDEVTGYLASGGLTSVPSVTKTVTAANYANAVVLSLTVYELDKSGILDHTVGIDSIPVPGLKIIFSKRDGTGPIEVISGSDGKVTISTTWEALGVSDVQTIATSQPAKTITINLTWTGEYKNQSFARYSQVVFSKAAS
jgi:hypothetical protein